MVVMTQENTPLHPPGTYVHKDGRTRRVATPADGVSAAFDGFRLETEADQTVEDDGGSDEEPTSNLEGAPPEAPGSFSESGPFNTTY